MFRKRNEEMTYYQRIKRRAARGMTITGIATLCGAAVSLFVAGLEFTLFLGAASLGFLLVGYQQQIDAIAADKEHPQKEEPDD